MAARVTSFRRAVDLGYEPFDIVVLDAEQRHLRRRRVTLSKGEDVLVDFEKPVRVEHGDKLVLDDGRVAEVIAAEEELMEVRAGDPRHLVELAWHIGNRHLAAEFAEGRILLRRDRVIREMLEKLGATVADVTAPFAPALGAYHTHDY
jgi:urease accessory protein